MLKFAKKKIRRQKVNTRHSSGVVLVGPPRNDNARRHLRISQRIFHYELIGKKYDGLMYVGLSCFWARCHGGICAHDSELSGSKEKLVIS